MATPATTIAECISFAPNYIAQVTYDGPSQLPPIYLETQMLTWTASLFDDLGILPPSGDGNASYRRMTDWYGQHLIAIEQIESLLTPGVVGASACINAVERILSAISMYGSVAQQTATIALFNTVWAVI